MNQIFTIFNTKDYQNALQTAAEVLRNGGVAAIPTDTVYGFAAMVSDEKAISRLYQIKERARNKSIAVLLGDAAQADLVALEFPAKARRLAEKYWPGALTIIIRKKDGLPPDLTSNELVGLRIPDNEFTRDLIRLTGPLAVTSANISGEAPARSVSDLPEELEGKLDLIIDGGKCIGGVPSSVINCGEDPAVILREGAISAKELLEC